MFHLRTATNFFAKIAKRFNQSMDLGEILAGVFWVPTIVGTLAPQLSNTLFPQQGGGALVLDGMRTLAINRSYSR